MKPKILIAFILNGLLFLYSLNVFINKGISGDFSWWRFSFSLAGVIIFGIFLILLVKQLKTD